MKIRMKRLIYSCILVLSTSLSLMSCQYKEFEDYDGTVPVKVVVDYSLLDFTPEVTRVMFYPKEGQFTNPYKVDVKDSMYVNLPSGLYDIVAYNNDSEINRLDDDTEKDSVRVYVPESRFQVSKNQDSVLYDYPDRFAVSHLKNVGLYTDGSCHICDGRSVRIYPEETTKQINLVIRGVKNLQYGKSFHVILDSTYVSSYLTGVSKGAIGRLSCEAITDSSSIRYSFNIFSLVPSVSKYCIRLAVSNGSSNKLYRFDVTNQITSHLDKKTIDVAIDTDITIEPDIQKNGAGFDIGVDDWTEENEVEINM